MVSMTTTSALALAALAVALVAVLFAAIACEGAREAQRTTIEPTEEERARMRAILAEYAARDSHHGRMWANLASETLGEVPTVTESLEVPTVATVAPDFGPWAHHGAACRCNVCR